ncbi:MAG: ribosome-binding factor A, partial [Clostridia bacterium]|nr:ribosome-binding factor A [Clostridia bacterium]
MSKYRKSRVDAAFSRAVSEILRDVKDPRVSGVMLSVLDADVTADFRYAKVYYSVYGECDEK